MNTPSFVVVDTDQCIGCGICADECPFDAIAIENELAVILDSCTGCLTCVEACPIEALSASATGPRTSLPRNQLSPADLFGSFTEAGSPGCRGVGGGGGRGRGRGGRGRGQGNRSGKGRGCR